MFLTATVPGLCLNFFLVIGTSTPSFFLLFSFFNNRFGFFLCRFTRSCFGGFLFWSLALSFFRCSDRGFLFSIFGLFFLFSPIESNRFFLCFGFGFVFFALFCFGFFF